MTKATPVQRPRTGSHTSSALRRLIMSAVVALALTGSACAGDGIEILKGKLSDDITGNTEARQLLSVKSNRAMEIDMLGVSCAFLRGDTRLDEYVYRYHGCCHCQQRESRVVKNPRSAQSSSASTTGRRVVTSKEIPFSNASISSRDGRRSETGRGMLASQ